MQTEIDNYTYRVMWSEDDHDIVGLCAEFPGLSWLAPSSQEAFQGIYNVIGECVEDMMQQGEDIPQPLAMRQSSGKCIVRIPPEVHRHLAIDAAESGASLINRLASVNRAQ